MKPNPMKNSLAALLAWGLAVSPALWAQTIPACSEVRYAFPTDDRPQGMLIDTIFHNGQVLFTAALHDVVSGKPLSGKCTLTLGNQYSVETDLDKNGFVRQLLPKKIWKERQLKIEVAGYEARTISTIRWEVANSFTIDGAMQPTNIQLPADAPTVQLSAVNQTMDPPYNYEPYSGTFMVVFINQKHLVKRDFRPQSLYIQLKIEKTCLLAVPKSIYETMRYANIENDELWGRTPDGDTRFLRAPSNKPWRWEVRLGPKPHLDTDQNPVPPTLKK